MSRNNHRGRGRRARFADEQYNGRDDNGRNGYNKQRSHSPYHKYNSNPPPSPHRRNFKPRRGWDQGEGNGNGNGNVNGNWNGNWNGNGPGNGNRNFKAGQAGHRQHPEGRLSVPSAGGGIGETSVKQEKQ